MLGRILLFCLLLSVGIVSAQFPPTHFITSSPTQNLTALSSRLATNPDSGVHVVRFSSYSNIGTFRIDGAPRIDTLIFERDPRLESDSVLDVAADMPLFEIKRMARTTVIFRGLAFRMISPSSILLAGWEPGKENLNLILDSCFIFGDTLSSSFLNWNSTASGRVDLRRTFLSAKAGNPLLSKIFLTAGNVALNNNVLAFPGYVHANIVGGRFDARNNTINRTQFKLEALANPGTSPGYSFISNLIAHAGEVDALSQAQKYVLQAGSGFAPIGIVVSYNKMFETSPTGWADFDNPANPVPRSFRGQETNQFIPALADKARDEMWRWSPSDTSAGFEGGEFKWPHPFNVWPGVDSAAITFEFNPGHVFFRPAHFPRFIMANPKVQREPADTAIPLAADFRTHTPKEGAIRFGAFQVDSIVMPGFANYGHPILLAAENGGLYRSQRLGAGYSNQSRNVFVNDSLKARRFFLGFKGNTPRGTNVVPININLGTGGLLSYAKVDTAGETDDVLEIDNPPDNLTDSLRALGKQFQISTTAAVAGGGATMRYGFEPRIAPHLPDRVSWLNTETGELTPIVPKGEGNYPATIPAVRSLKTILVERLNVKRGKTNVFELSRGGSVHAKSVEGFQLLIDSTKSPNPLHYGPPTKAYSFTWPGRGLGDSVKVHLPDGPDYSLFMMYGDTVRPISSHVREGGFFKFNLIPGEAGRPVFSAIPFNILGGDTANKPIDNVTVLNLLSATSGKLGFAPLGETMLEENPGASPVLPDNRRVLGGRVVSSRFLSPDTSTYSVQYTINRAGILDSIEAFAFDGTAWRKLAKPVYSPDSSRLTLQGIRIGDKAFVALELLADPADYVTDSVAIKAGERVVSVGVSYKDSVNKPIASFTLIVTTIDDTGGVTKVEKGPLSIGQVASVDLKAKSGLHSYSVLYHRGDSTPYIPNPKQEHITEFSWLPEAVSPRQGTGRQLKGQWYAVGIPGNSDFERTLKVSPSAASGTSTERTRWIITDIDTMPRWDSALSGQRINPSPGTGYLVAADVERIQDWHPSDSFLPPTPKLLTAPFENSPFKYGWRLISPPFPITFDAAMVKSTHAPLSRFYRLEANRGDTSRTYSWKQVTTLEPWEAYAYYFRPEEALTFDPWYARAPKGVTGKVAGEKPVGVEVRLTSGGESRSMQFASGPAAWSIPYLPAPGASLEMRVGGRGGYFLKSVATLRGIDEPVRIYSPQARTASLEAVPEQGSVDAAWAVRLIDLGTGKVYDQGSLGSVELPTGVSEFRLLAGDPAFVEERARNFQAGLPVSIGLSQNFPNPFRHTTRIALEWPALAGGGEGASRRARLEIFDARGRQVQEINLGKVKPGRQELTLDASHWESGIYTYRLTVDTGRGAHRLQKRMLVAR